MKKLSIQIVLLSTISLFISCKSKNENPIEENITPKESSKTSDTANNDNLKKLEIQLRKSDTILLVSHDQTYGPIFNESDDSYTEATEIVENGVLNKKLIHKTKLIEGQEREELISILTSKRKNLPIDVARCFDPRQAIIIIDKKNVAFIDFCFGCGGITTDKMAISSDDFDKEKWDKIFNYFESKVPFKS